MAHPAVARPGARASLELAVLPLLSLVILRTPRVLLGPCRLCGAPVVSMRFHCLGCLPNLTRGCRDSRCSQRPRSRVPSLVQVTGLASSGLAFILADRRDDASVAAAIRTYRLVRFSLCCALACPVLSVSWDLPAALSCPSMSGVLIDAARFAVVFCLAWPNQRSWSGNFSCLCLSRARRRSPSRARSSCRLSSRRRNCKGPNTSPEQVRARFSCNRSFCCLCS